MAVDCHELKDRTKLKINPGSKVLIKSHFIGYFIAQGPTEVERYLFNNNKKFVKYFDHTTLTTLLSQYYFDHITLTIQLGQNNFDHRALTAQF